MKIYPNENSLFNEQADIIDEVNENLTYLGFFNSGSKNYDEDVDQCKIMQIKTTGTVTTRFWADGENINYCKNWNDRNDNRYTYKLRR